jgi:hypothetical protein
MHNPCVNTFNANATHAEGTTSSNPRPAPVPLDAGYFIGRIDAGSGRCRRAGGDWERLVKSDVRLERKGRKNGSERACWIRIDSAYDNGHPEIRTL